MAEIKTAMVEGDVGERIEIASGDRTLAGYRAAPAGGGPGVLVLHAWWGLTETFTGVCERLAREGFVALAPDLYDGQTAATIPEAKSLVQSLFRRHEEAEAMVAAAAERLRRDPAVTSQRIGGIGFSMGAMYLMGLAAEPSALGAAVLFYGGGDCEAEQAARTKAAILGHFAENDEFEPPFEEALRLQEQLRAAGVDATFHLYPGTSHWFFEENRPDAYDPAAAQLAWDRTLEFLRERLT